MIRIQITLSSQGKLHIDGKLRDATGGARYEDINPWTGDIAGYAADGSAADIAEGGLSFNRGPVKDDLRHHAIYDWVSQMAW